MNFQDAFINLLSISPSHLTTSNDVFCVIEQYVYRMYSLKVNDVNATRFQIFEKSFRNRHQDEAVFKNKLLSFDASSMPPTKEELLQQCKRTIYISSVWCNAHMRNPTDLRPENCGWTIIDDSYQHYWFDGTQSPSFAEISSNVEGTVTEIFVTILRTLSHIIRIYIRQLIILQIMTAITLIMMKQMMMMIFPRGMKRKTKVQMNQRKIDLLYC